MKRSPSRIRIICTDEGQHPSRDLGLIDWQPDNDEDARVWDAKTPLDELRAVSLVSSGRTTNGGKWYATTRGASIQTETRKDGGSTFVTQCPTCSGSRAVHRLRDDTLRRFLECDTPVDPLDVSLIP